MEWTDQKTRCFWANPKNERYIRYHDEEWGVPVHDDRHLFEMLVAGLSRPDCPGSAFSIKGNISGRHSMISSRKKSADTEKKR